MYFYMTAWVSSWVRDWLVVFSLIEAFKCPKERLEMMLTQSEDLTVRTLTYTHRDIATRARGLTQDILSKVGHLHQG